MGGKMQVLSFEPDADLCKVLELARLSDRHRTKVYNTGISDGSGSLAFYKAADISGSFDYEFVNGQIRQGEKVEDRFESIAVPVAALDDLLTDREANRVRVIKLDVEGFEYKAVLGAEKIIRTDAPLICLEYNDKREAVLDLLKDSYSCYHYDYRINKFVRPNCRNSLNYWLIPTDGTNDDAFNMILNGMLDGSLGTGE
jgi:FkbM family methyltransferase